MAQNKIKKNKNRCYIVSENKLGENIEYSTHEIQYFKTKQLQLVKYLPYMEGLSWNLIWNTMIYKPQVCTVYIALVIIVNQHDCIVVTD